MQYFLALGCAQYRQHYKFCCSALKYFFWVILVHTWFWVFQDFSEQRQALDQIKWKDPLSKTKMMGANQQNRKMQKRQQRVKQPLNSLTLWLCPGGSCALCRSASAEVLCTLPLQRGTKLAAISDAQQVDLEGRLWWNALSKHTVHFRDFLDKVTCSTGLGGCNFRWTSGLLVPGSLAWSCLFWEIWE